MTQPVSSFFQLPPKKSSIIRPAWAQNKLPKGPENSGEYARRLWVHTAENMAGVSDSCLSDEDHHCWRTLPTVHCAQGGFTAASPPVFPMHPCPPDHPLVH